MALGNINREEASMWQVNNVVLTAGGPPPSCSCEEAVRMAMSEMRIADMFPPKVRKSAKK